MVDKTISLLESRGVRLDGQACVLDTSSSIPRLNMARTIANKYQIFHELRPFFRRGTIWEKDSLSGDVKRLLEVLAQQKFITENANSYSPNCDDNIQKFLTGGWLEELAGHASKEAGADAVLVSQKLSNHVLSFKAEVDVIARKGEHLLFVSCKTGNPDLVDVETQAGKLQRKKLTGYLHEADNLPELVGFEEIDRAALVVSTDLIDEAKAGSRYKGLHGKANKLGVELISLDHLQWPNLVGKFKALFNAMAVETMP